MDKKRENSDRRKFLKLGLIAGGAAIAGAVIKNNLSGKELKEEAGKKIKVLTAEGKLLEIDSSQVYRHHAEDLLTEHEVREGIEGRKFVMVIDLARCANLRKCIEGCQTCHHKQPPVEWIKVKEMQESEATSPYWMPQPCFHCDNPPCTKVCPVDATFKRQDGIVMIDDERCIGCRFCMAACPYNARLFNWGDHWGETPDMSLNIHYDHNPERGYPAKTGTVQKCDFCPDMSRKGELPDCVTYCPNGVIYFGDANEDVVSNGDETVRLSELLSKKGGYRYLEELGTEPRVYYLPPTNRMFSFEEDNEIHNAQE